VDRETLEALTQLFLNCEDLETDEDIEAALRGFGLNPDEFLKLVPKTLDKHPICVVE